jgi:membrane fusion protein, multidrug efflux system
MESTSPPHERQATIRRAGGLFLKRLQGRSTLVTVLLVALVVGVAMANVRNGTTLGGITGRESTISSHIAGYVQSVPVRDNQVVRAGQVVATIEDDDYRAKVKAAEAALGAARSAVEVLANDALLQSQKVAAAAAQVRAAEAGLKQTRLQQARQRALVDDGTTSHRELESAEADEERLNAARDQTLADLAAARQMLQVIRAQGVEAEQDVKAKEAALELARIDLGYTRIVSPASGQLADRAALPGEYATPGTKIGMLVPLPHVWVVANFRESQMAHMAPGQSALVSVDSVPGTQFRGTVESFGPASGALQALLPPDNATGNFTKIAQRFAIKIVLAPGQAGIERLRPGMSSIVSVEVR